MEEKIYKMLGRAGSLDLVLGIISIVSGVTIGVMLIIGGARLLTGKGQVLL
ncbi:MAG: hypothetical protein IJU50_01655 [Lachnospiraceae bacterium]|nr:hypothetical protein [Lachnospiraceae bacterium]